MNELIKKLKEQATSYTWNGNDVTEELDEQKFAELIVLKCAEVITNGGYWSGGPVGPKRQCTPPEIAEMIKDVFGVKK